MDEVTIRPARLDELGIAADMRAATAAGLRSRGCVVARLRTSDEGRPLYEALGFVAGTEMELPL